MQDVGFHVLVWLVFLSRDTHYNVTGNQLAAGIIADALGPMMTSVATSQAR